MTNDSLFFDWLPGNKKNDKLTLLDESLRDGVQSSCISLPSFEQQQELIYSMDQIGIDFLDIGYPGASPQAADSIKELIRYIDDSKLSIKPCFAGRTHKDDIVSMVDISQELGRYIEPLLFIGVSSIRLLVEGWDLSKVLSMAKSALEFSSANNLKPTLVIEDATRASMATLIELYKLAIELDLSRIIICDTVGQSTPTSVHTLINWTLNYFEHNHHNISLDWHGHNDRGLALANSLQAIESGCDRIHGTALGIGERAGNASIDQLISNLYLSGYENWAVNKLDRYIYQAAEYFETEIPENYPVFGSNVFNTASGIHASAISKAVKMDDQKLADLIYSSIPASDFNRKNTIEINSMSGRSNVIYYLEHNNIEICEYLIQDILEFAKSRRKKISAEEINFLVKKSNKPETILRW